MQVIHIIMMQRQGFQIECRHTYLPIPGFNKQVGINFFSLRVFLSCFAKLYKSVTIHFCQSHALRVYTNKNPQIGTNTQFIFLFFPLFQLIIHMALFSKKKMFLIKAPP